MATPAPALEFYQSVFGGQLVISTYADFGMPKETPGADDVVFGQVASEIDVAPAYAA